MALSVDANTLLEESRPGKHDGILCFDNPMLDIEDMPGVGVVMLEDLRGTDYTQMTTVIKSQAASVPDLQAKSSLSKQQLYIQEIPVLQSRQSTNSHTVAIVHHFEKIHENVESDPGENPTILPLPGYPYQSQPPTANPVTGTKRVPGILKHQHSTPELGVALALDKRCPYCHRRTEVEAGQTVRPTDGTHHVKCPYFYRGSRARMSVSSVSPATGNGKQYSRGKLRVKWLAGREEDDMQKKEDEKKEPRKVSWPGWQLWQRKGGANDDWQQTAGEGSNQEKRTRKQSISASISRLFSRQKRDVNDDHVFTVTDGISLSEVDMGRLPSSSSVVDDEAAGQDHPKRSSAKMVPQNSTRSRVHDIDEEDEIAVTALHGSPTTMSTSSGSLVQLSIGDLSHNEDKAVSDSSSMTSSSPGSKHSIDFKALLRSAQMDAGEGERTESPTGGKERCHAKGESGDITNGSPHHSPSLGARLCKNQKHSLSSYDLTDCNPSTDGPHGKLFTAKLVNRIGKGNMLSNIMDVTYVGGDILLVTDLLEGKILCVTKNGRTAKHFLTERGSEPWSSCVTPQGYVAVTLKRSACVAVWAGDGGLVREFGHGVLSCPTGLACDRQGRFIVTDERTNRVAFFSSTGEFLRYFSHPPQDETNDKHSSQHNNANKPRSQRQDGRHLPSTPTEDEDNRSGSDKENRQQSREPVVAGKNRRRTSSESSDDTDDEDSADEQQYGFTPKRTIDRNMRPKHYRPEAPKYGQPDRTYRSKNQKAKESNGEELGKNNKSNSSKNSNNNNNKMSEGTNPPPEEDCDDQECEPFVFNLPRYVCLSPSGKIIVSDSGSHSVKVFSAEGRYLTSIGSYGSSDGQLKVPYGICCDQHENIFVADHYNDRVSVFSIDGQFVQHALTVVSGLVRPKAVAVQPASTQTLYVAHGGLRSTEILAYHLVPEQTRIMFTCEL